MAYKRGNALLYAAGYFNKVCDDGYIAVKDYDDKSVLVKRSPGSLLRPVLNEDDCAHFLSCCIGRFGGGLHLGRWDIPPAYGVLSPDGLLKRLTDSGLATRNRRARHHNLVSRRTVTWRSETPSLTAFKASNSLGPTAICIQYRVRGCIRHPTATD